MSPWLLGSLGVVAAGGVALAVRDGGSTGSDSASYTVSGSVTAGPVIGGHGLSVTAYDKDGNPLGTAKVASDGAYSMSITNGYSGVVLVRVSDADDGADYFDEASAEGEDLTVDLRALSVSKGANLTVHITPLTELAVIKAGTFFCNKIILLR